MGSSGTTARGARLGPLPTRSAGQRTQPAARSWRRRRLAPDAQLCRRFSPLFVAVILLAWTGVNLRAVQRIRDFDETVPRWRSPPRPPPPRTATAAHRSTVPQPSPERAFHEHYKIVGVLASWHGDPRADVFANYMESYMDEQLRGRGIEFRMVVVTQLQRSKTWFMEGFLRNIAVELAEPWDPTHYIFFDIDIVPVASLREAALSRESLQSCMHSGSRPRAVQLYVRRDPGSSRSKAQDVESIGGAVLVSARSIEGVGGYSDCPSRTFRKPGLGRAARSLAANLAASKAEITFANDSELGTTYGLASKLDIQSEFLKRPTNCEHGLGRDEVDVFSWTSTPANNELHTIQTSTVVLSFPGANLTDIANEDLHYRVTDSVKRNATGKEQMLWIPPALGGESKVQFVGVDWCVDEAGQLASCQNATRWRRIATSKGVGQFQLRSSNFCLTSARTKVRSVPCSKSLLESQVWARTGLVQVRSAESGHCLSRDAQAKEVVLAPCAETLEWSSGVVDSAALPSPSSSSPQLHLIVPYRHRQLQLTIFERYMRSFLRKQGVAYQLHVVEQADDAAFNRGLLLNIGFKMANGSADDYFVFHDVDYLPLPGTSYQKQPYVLSLPASMLEGRQLFHAPYIIGFAGGVLEFGSAAQFERVNGFSNLYKGWGYEDNDMSLRLQVKGLYRHGRNLRRALPDHGRYYLLYYNDHASTRANHSGFSANKELYAARAEAGRNMSLETDGLSSVDGLYRLVEVKTGETFRWIRVATVQ